MVEHGLIALVMCQGCGLVEDDIDAAVAIDWGDEWSYPCPRCGSVTRDAFPVDEGAAT